MVATSSSDAKLTRARKLGADATLNYKAEKDWGAKAAELAGGGVDHVVEVGGLGTLAQSLRAVGFGGEVALIGVLSMQGDTNPMPLMVKGASLRGIFVGSSAMARDLNAFVDAHQLKPVVDRVFDFAEAKAAYTYQASAELFGKVVIANPRLREHAGRGTRRAAPPRAPAAARLFVCVAYKLRYDFKSIRGVRQWPRAI